MIGQIHEAVIRYPYRTGRSLLPEQPFGLSNRTNGPNSVQSQPLADMYCGEERAKILLDTNCMTVNNNV